jgi:hypothetical protein
MGEFMGTIDHDPTTRNIDMGSDTDKTSPLTGMEGTAPEAAGVEAGSEAEIPGYETDVKDCRADDVVKQGKDEFPCFDVSSDEFLQNMQDGRRRLRWKSGSEAQKYMSGTKYNRPFYVRHTDTTGKKYVRKIK